ncbi:sister chromatid cohesion protein PDS5 homolog A-like isoform X2 [Vigna unguiculata]|uniref:sister chromatid cohesion protein PDS5 homolog A-like isoform X2 n=1 Tax=Vigna unguiculata TaxID=3917 RepID=UPI001016EDCC|nr:sister chromatid cohesion protein PDS5 homolog A-like isoform X2 [Vigna unguiculata]
MAQKPHLQLKELGSKLETLPSSKDAIVKLLKQATPCLAELDQSPSTSTLESMKPFFNAIVKPELLKHQDRDVKLLVATCVCEITRITAPEAPYSDDILKDIFHLFVGTFRGLSDTNGASFGRRVVILETLAKYRSCVVMLDLECNDLVNEMFSIFFAVARDDHPESVLSSMQTIMVVLLEESEDVREDLLSILLSKLGREKKAVNMAARRLAMNVIQQCVGKLEPSIKQFLLSLMSGDSKPVNNQVEYHGVIYDLYCCAPQILSGVLPYVTGELLSDQLETRLKAMNLVGDIISLPGSSISEAFQPIFSEFLKRLTDRVVDVRMSVLEHVKKCLLLNPFRAEAPLIISALCERLLDFDENVRKQVVAVICDVTCHALNAVPLETVKLVSERLRDKSLLVKKYTMERLAEVYRVVCEKSSDTVNPNEYNWIPGRILRCFYDKDFRSDIIESVLCGSLFPVEFSVSVIAKHWIGVFSGFDRVEVKALEKILEQKQRLQQEMQKYLSLRQLSQDKDIPEVQKKILFCFRVMSRSFADPVKAEESFLILDQLKDANIWKILTNLVDPNTSLHQARAHRDDLLKILGEKHRLYEFLNTFSVKCSYLLFNKEHVKTILLETTAQKSAENAQHTQSCMNILVIIARFSPLLLRGSEEELVNLLKDNDDTIKEGVLNAVAKAGATIREQLAVTSSSVDLILEKLCLEGSRRQAKYAVHALAAITKDDGLKSLSVLYKKLVDMLEDKTHLPAVLQSLGCIAQTAMSVYVTREKEIEEFILKKILKSDSQEDNPKTSWDGESDLCKLKIYGIKTFVKSYLPVKDAHVRPDIDRILDILRNILLYGEVSKDLKSSSVDKAHLKLASAKAVLRLSRLWDHKIPVDLFHLTLRVSEDSFPQVRKILLGKIHHYIKDRLLDAKYACAFLLNIFGSKPNKFAEDKQNLADIIQMHHQLKARQLSSQSDANSLATYPEYILPYLVHTLAHNSCPDVDDCKEFGAYDDIYRQFHLILSMLLQRDEDVKSEVTTDKEKEIISTITCIFLSIKHSEDVVDTSKSKNSHALCDLGLTITRRLVQKDVDLLGLSHLVSLPPMLYKASEKEGDDTGVTEVKSWLADENALAHFESLELDMVHSQSAENEASKDDEKDGNEMPLRKMLKHIKSKGTSGKKGKRNKSVPAETKKAESDFDTVNMARQINGDNLGTSSNVEASNGHGHSLSKKALKDLDSAAGKKRQAKETTPVPVPKRRRSSSTHGKLTLSTSISKTSRRVSGEESPQPKLLLDEEVNPDADGKAIQKKMVKGSEKDLLLSSLKQKVNVSDGYHNDELNKPDEHDMMSLDRVQLSDKTVSNINKSSTGSTKKGKRKSIAGMAKCTTKGGEIDIEDLIGCKIKVWWPMDKKFYGGTIKSYDPLKRKHVILYEDGDVEILRLEKERWELVDKGRKSTKIKLSSLEASGQKHKGSSGSSRKKAKKIINGNQPSSKPVNRASKNNLHHEDAKETSEMSNPKETAAPKANEMYSGDSEEELTGGFEEITRKEKSIKGTKSGSRGKRLRKEKNFRYTEESNEERQDYNEMVSEDRESVPQDSSEERELDKSNGALRENINGEELDSERREDDSDAGSSPREMARSHIEPSKSRYDDEHDTKAEISDDVPLSKWKRRMGKKSSRKEQ